MDKKATTIDLVVVNQFRGLKTEHMLPKDLVQLIIKYIKDTVTIIITEELEEAFITSHPFTIKPHILKLSLKLHKEWDESQDYLQPIILTKEELSIKIETFTNIMEYLQHHDGNKPPALPCPVRSTDMKQIVTDPWDADFIDKYNKKQIFEIILAANSLDCPSLLHLGCAKIATLIKQLDQKEINRVIEEEEQYRKDNQLEAPTQSITPPLTLNLDVNEVNNDENDDDNATEITPNSLYRDQLDRLIQMGFTNENTNLNALITSGGNIEASIEIIISANDE